MDKKIPEKLSCKAIKEANLTKDQIIEIACDILNEGINNDEAAYLFSYLARPFQTTYLFEPRTRLFYRDDVVNLLSKWLAQDYDRDTDITPESLRRFYSIFTNLEVRPPQFFSEYLTGQLYKNRFSLRLRDGVEGIKYHSVLGMRIAKGCFDILCQPVIESFQGLSFEETVEFLQDMAVLHSLDKDKRFETHSPQSMYSQIKQSDCWTRSQRETLKPYYLRCLERAEYWFDRTVSETSYPYRHAPSEKTGSRKEGFCIEGAVLVDEFRGSQVKPSSLGIDAVYRVGGKDIGFLSDRRSGYISQMGTSRVAYPSGRTVFNSASLAQFLPEQIILRVPSCVQKHIAPQEMASIFDEVASKPPSVYCLNMRREIVPVGRFALVS